MHGPWAPLAVGARGTIREAQDDNPQPTLPRLSIFGRWLLHVTHWVIQGPHLIFQIPLCPAPSPAMDPAFTSASVASTFL